MVTEVRYAGFLDEVEVLKGFPISPNVKVTVSVKNETIGAIDRGLKVVEAKRTTSCMRSMALRRSTGSLYYETYATLFPHKSVSWTVHKGGYPCRGSKNRSFL
ncbi:PREDICTED: uncharacterized protein LOC109356417 isoform X2 [Lupinus angustifolius]|uniref:uncharacterized protein LOC109356417 isoform X2 n=1 Tax=Lupinus angustifolius TaxID=3871 RepID=UPI00092F672F|nr:PREDICTED: uncharacterized protein LOC109356417 isoform X2 [Lupinus angustifolius]